MKAGDQRADLLTLDDVGVLVGSSGVKAQDAISKHAEHVVGSIVQEPPPATGRQAGDAESHFGQRY